MTQSPKIRLGSAAVLFAAVAAAYGAQEMTEEAEVFAPDRYRRARWLNHQGRRQLRELGASSSAVIANLLGLDDPALIG